MDVMNSAAAPDGLAVVTVGLTRRYGQRTAVNGISLQVPRGAIAGFVGPNGAGKTTTLRMLLGLIAPSAGSGSVLGAPLTRPPEYLGRVGALIEGPAFYPALSGWDNLRVLARLGRIPDARIAEVLARVGLASRAGDRFRSYSLGMKQRLGIAAALLPSPELLILDEPANGLDPAGIVEMRSLLRSLADEGGTILVSSHLLSEIEHICDHLIVIRDGSLRFQGTLAQLAGLGSPELVIRPDNSGDIDRVVGLLTSWGLPARVDDANGRASVRVSADPETAGSLNYALMKAGVVLAELRPQQQSLEESFFALTDPQASGSGSAERPPASRENR
jgi:ABC-2 type transport system ATP-binding protein